MLQIEHASCRGLGSALAGGHSQFGAAPNQADEFVMAESMVLAELTLIVGVDPTYQLLNLLTDNPPVLLSF